MKYKFLEHTADIKFRASGKTLAEAFENSVLAVSEVLAKKKKVGETITKKVKVEGEDEKELLYKLLDEMNFQLDANNFLVASAKIKIKGKSLDIEFKGDDSTKYDDLDHIKAATYAEMEINKTAKGYEVQVVVDV